MADSGFVVTRPYPGSGIGSNLVSFAGAVWLASVLDREVIVDWRNSDFLQDKSANLFTQFLERVDAIQSVPVHYAEGTELNWEDGTVDGVLLLEPSDVSALVRRRSAEPYVVLTAFHSYARIEAAGDPFAQHKRLHDFLGYIRPRASLQEKIDDFVAVNDFEAGFVVAVNIATGNGEYRKGSPFHGRVDTDLFRNERRFLGKIAQARDSALRRLPGYLREHAKTFVATDAAFMREILLKLPNAFTRRSVFPPPGVGRAFADYDVPGYSDRDAFEDIVIDHFLLARCNALIRNPSMFSTYALLTTDFYDGNFRDLESMYPRHYVRAALRRARRVLLG